MKNLLIIGNTSYIARAFMHYLAEHPQLNITTKSISSRSTEEDIDFSAYHSVLFTAGIAHRKQTADNQQLYYDINRDLAVTLATRAKAAGAGQFIYLSSMAVYGVTTGAIGPDTPLLPNPRDHYATSKQQAETQLQALASDDFAVTILRPPLVYGEGCPGKYNTLRKIAKQAPVLPTYTNQRSMVHVDNLSQIMADCIHQPATQILCPQDDHYHCTSHLLAQLAADMGRKPIKLALLNPFIAVGIPMIPTLKTAFGDLYYVTDSPHS